VDGGLGGLGILRPGRNPSKEGRPAKWQHPRRWVRREDEPAVATGVSEVRSHRHHGKKTPVLVAESREAKANEVACSMTIRRSGLRRREASGPPVIPHGALDSVGRPRSESCESEPGTREVRVHAVRLGGRHRLDASRVFSTGSSQGLLVKREGASQEEVRSTADAGRGWAEGETVRVRRIS
jgi:hypothetical protein